METGDAASEAALKARLHLFALMYIAPDYSTVNFFVG